MITNEKLCFVQLIHPGGEPTASRGGIWNRGDHVRKFLRVRGECVLDGRLVEGELDFWGEWEAESKLLDEYSSPIPGGPARVWRPYWLNKDNYRGLQNTDPFVFGGFRYTGCMQRRKNGPNQLRYLAKGSVVLFGSRVGGQFVVDTVFVVDYWIDHHADNYRRLLAGKVPDAYWDVTLEPRYANESGKESWICLPGEGLSWRLYFGATYDEPVDGIFSFTPCQMSGTSGSGFARPTIDLSGIVKPGLQRSYLLNPQKDLADIVDLWKMVADQVQAQGLAMGVSLEVPCQKYEA